MYAAFLNYPIMPSIGVIVSSFRIGALFVESSASTLSSGEVFLNSFVSMFSVPSGSFVLMSRSGEVEN